MGATDSRVKLAQWLERELGYRAGNLELAQAALTHRSAGGRNNERLEFLGDAILNCVVADMLYRRFADADEGELSRLRARLVRGEALADLATELELGEQLILGAGELRSGGIRRRSILADALEALFGAIYLDGGFAAAAEVIERVTSGPLAAIAAGDELKDPKTRLQEYLQGRGMALPAYAVERIEGESHMQVFTVNCEVAALQLRASGQGTSRRGAEQEAARQVLAALESAGTAD